MFQRPPSLQPDELLHFVELDEFAQDWQRLGLDLETDLWALQVLIMSNPKGAPVIEGTGGLRKVRFTSRRMQRGKSGAVRVCYAYFEEHWIVLLVMAYGKNQKDTLSAGEKAGIRAYLEATKKWLAARS